MKFARLGLAWRLLDNQPYMDVIVVESPNKVKSLNKYLGKNYKVLASFGHVRDLPAKDGSVKPDDDFAMSWSVDVASAKRLTNIAKAVNDADGLILATDPDREGEAIAWHVLEVLKQERVLGDKAIKRVAFNSITKQAVLEAIASPREVNQQLVDAYLARRALDYLVGFTLSPVLWRKLPGARSAGRVQSVALRFVCDREAEIERFICKEYWQITVILRTPRAEIFEARLMAFDGKKLQKLDISSQEMADDIKAMLDGSSFKAMSVEAKPIKRNPAPPFTTSTLQQAASSHLGFSASHTMQVAQRLYEGMEIGDETSGLITYMRTDGVQMAPEAITAARGVIGKEFGAKYLPENPSFYTTRAKNAQEAHEAIRPTDFTRTPSEMRKYLDADQARLYYMIWRRAIASQMQSAEIERTIVEIEARNGAKVAGLRAVGSVTRFDGFIATYTDKKDKDSDYEESHRLPEIHADETLKHKQLNASHRMTEPPPRYSEASFIKKMEELGIGRPSTYVVTLKTLEERDYVKIENRKLVPQPQGRLVTAFMESFFEHYVEYDFTASLEAKLDEISGGKLAWRNVLRDFWKDFSGAVDEIKELRVTDVLDALNEELAPLVFPEREDNSNPRICQKCDIGNLSLKLGKFGAFVGCSNYPECDFTRQLDCPGANSENGGLEEGTKVLGIDPYTNEEITLRSGRFGPYIQRGDGKEAKRSSLPKDWVPATIDHEKALALLALPRDVGQHPESGKMISTGLGRYGPFVLHDGTYAKLESIEDVFSIDLNRAVTVLVKKQSKMKGARGGETHTALKDLGEHPDGGGNITVHNGRYGAYVSFGKVKATMPKGMDPASITLKDAFTLIADKEAKDGGGKKHARTAAQKTSAKRHQHKRPPPTRPNRRTN